MGVRRCESWFYANPVPASFGATLHREVVKTLRSRGYEIDDCDLYAERFDPVLSEQERMQYHDLKLNRAHIATYVDRLLAAEALILVYPVWNERLSGDPERLLRPSFHSRRELYGEPRRSAGNEFANAAKDRCRLHLWSRPYHQCLARRPSQARGETPSALDARPSCSLRLFAYYGMDHSTQEQRAALQAKVNGHLRLGREGRLPPLCLHRRRR